MKFSANSVWENKDKYDVVVIGAGRRMLRLLLPVPDLGFRQLYLRSVLTALH